MTILPPGDGQHPTIQHHLGPSTGNATTGGSNQGRTGTGTAGLGNPGTTLPHPHPQAIGGQNLDHLNIRPFRKQRVVLDLGAEPVKRDRLGILDQKHNMGITHADRNRIRQLTTSQIEMEGVGWPGQGNLGPVHPSRPHVHRNQPGRFSGGPQQTSPSFNHHRSPSTLFQQASANTTGGIAASPNLTAICIENQHESVRVGRPRRRDHDQLIATDASMSIGEGANRRVAEGQRLAAGIENNEIVAKAVHLQEGCGHGGYYTSEFND
ncbi:hypothetical protein WCLP8_1190006 [uncultured Gammaproteobacteria bacterium]